MIKVWTDGAEAGLLDRHETRGSSFAYLPEVTRARAVSVTMPVRLPSWTVQFGLSPIFEMNLPEGVLRERLRLTFAKATGTFDEFDLWDRRALRWEQWDASAIPPNELPVPFISFANCTLPYSQHACASL